MLRRRLSEHPGGSALSQVNNNNTLDYAHHQPTPSHHTHQPSPLPLAESAGDHCGRGPFVTLGAPLTSDIMTSSRDRTKEFYSTLKSMQVRHSNGVVNLRAGARDKHLKSEFSVRAKKIGTDLSNTYAKLEKLTVLAKRRSLFDDKPLEINELTYIIKEDINQLNKQIGSLQNLVKLSGSNSASNSTSKHQQKHSSTIVVALQSRLASMSNSFKQVLEIRTANMKEQRNRRDNFAQSSVSSALPSSATQGYHVGSVLLQEDYNRENGPRDVAVNMDAIMQDQQLLEDTSYLESRANTMETIESTIVELGQIFQQLAHMVHEQEEMIQRIDSNVTDAQLNVEAAHTEILKYFQSISSNRWLMIKIFFVLIVFFIIFVVFLA